MQETTNTQTTNRQDKSSEPTVRENVKEELTRLRDQLSRTAHEMRMKTKNAGDEILETRDRLEQEVKRFNAEVDQAVEDTQADLVETGKELRMRFQKLANQIVLPPS